MCIGVPLRILRCVGDTAWCEAADGGEQAVDLLLVGPQPPGTWVLTFLGAAREVVSPERAARIVDALRAVEAALAGDAAAIDAAFADLVGREPELPDFLQGEAR